MVVLNPTPREKLTDGHGRPYFLWDLEMTLPEFESRLRDPDPEIRSYFLAKLMRQAKPDDVFTFVTRRAIRDHWPRLEHRLGRMREFWDWLLREWERLERAS